MRQHQQTPASADRRNPNPARLRRVAVLQCEEKFLASVVKQSVLLEERRPLSPALRPPRTPRFDLCPYLLLEKIRSCYGANAVDSERTAEMSSMLWLREANFVRMRSTRKKCLSRRASLIRPGLSSETASYSK